MFKIARMAKIAGKSNWPERAKRPKSTTWPYGPEARKTEMAKEKKKTKN